MWLIHFIFGEWVLLNKCTNSFAEILCTPNPSASFPGGEWVFSEDTKKLSIGTKSYLKCNSGYHKIGTPHSIICDKNGMWSKTNATCEGK